MSSYIPTHTGTFQQQSQKETSGIRANFQEPTLIIVASLWFTQMDIVWRTKVYIIMVLVLYVQEYVIKKTTRLLLVKIHKEKLFYITEDLRKTY